MYRFKRLLVGLVGTDRDATTVQYAGMVSRMVRSERTHFAHVARRLDVPRDIRRKYPELIGPVDDYLRDRMSVTATARFSGHPDTRMTFDVLKGAPLTGMMRLARQAEIDLVLVGKAKAHQGSGVLPEKLARKAPCSSLIVPEGSEPDIRRVLVAVDLSEFAADALQVAIALASAGSSPEVICLHVYEGPARRLQLANTYQHIAAELRDQTRRYCGRLVEKCDGNGCSVRRRFLDAAKPWEGIAEVADEERADLIVVGTPGKTAAAALLLGSVTERLIAATTIPLLAVKRKGTGLRLLDAILGT